MGLELALLEDVLGRIDREELARLAQDLVRIPSVYRPEEAGGNESSVAGFVADYLETRLRCAGQKKSRRAGPTSGPCGRATVRGRPCSSRRTRTW